MSKTALIVDDSPLARHVLGQMLAGHDLVTDTSPSAEAALDYLKHQRPDVIFMDHMMPGMDGFEALEAIKANPTTATIPVMMYTSQEGELYVGQARALGAFGVLPKDLKPVQVERVLKALHLIPGDRESDRASARERSETPDVHRIRELVEELLYQQRAAIRDDIREGCQRALAATQTLPASADSAPRPPGKVWTWSIGATAVVAVIFGYLYFNTNRLLHDTIERSAALAAQATQVDERETSAQPVAADAPRPAYDDSSLLAAVEWTLNRGGRYEFADIPLDDQRAQTISRLIGHLDRAGFRGTLAIEVHVGRFCMNAAANGSLELAPPGQPAAECTQIGWLPPEAVALGRRQTLAFANTIATATNDTGIRVVTTSAGSDLPAAEYPSMNGYLTAGEWNEAAAANQRVAVRLTADTGTYFSQYRAL
jgi:CheY-like chemotaxis protein